MRLTKKLQLILKMAEKTNKHFTIGGKNSLHTMFDGDRIFLQTKTQNEMIEKMATIFFDYELEEMYAEVGMESHLKN